MASVARHAAVSDLILAARLWPIWLRLGLQDVRLRFRRSSLGAGWIFVNLSIMIASVGVVYGKLLGQSLDGFLPFLTIGLVTWGYLTAAIVEGGSAFIASEGYVKQIGLPIYVYVFRFFVSTSITAAISVLAYVAIAVMYAVRFTWGVLWVLPGMVLLGVVAFLLVMIFAHVNARFRDAGHIASVGLQVLFYITPILWPADLLRSRGLAWVIDINPFYHLLEVVRRPLLSSEAPTTANFAAVGLLILGLTMIGAALIRHYERRIVYFL